MLVLMAVALVSVLIWLLSPEPNSKTVANVSPMLIVGAVYLGLAVVLTVVMTAMNMGKGRSNSNIGLWVFGGLAVLGVIFYFVVASSATVTGADGTVFDNVFTLKISDTMLYLAYAAGGLTILFLLWGEIRKALK